MAGDVVWKGRIGDIWGDSPLMRAYTDRTEAFLRGEEDMSPYNEMIDEIVYGSKEKAEKAKKKYKNEIELGKWYPVFRLIDYLRPTIGGKVLYTRLLVQELFSYRFVEDEGNIYAEMDFNPEVFPPGFQGNGEIEEYVRKIAEGAELVSTPTDKAETTQVVVSKTGGQGEAERGGITTTKKTNTIMEEDKEEWRSVEGYEGLYEVSNKGRVYSVKREYIGGYGAKCTAGGKILKPHINTERDNRVSVILCKNGKTKPHYISVLVAKAFPEICGEWFEGAEVDHKDTNTQNNVADNLRVCDRKGNMANPITVQNRKAFYESERGKEVRKENSKRMLGDNNPIRRCMTEEWRRKLNEAKKGRKVPSLYKKVRLIKDDIYMVFESVTEAAKFLGARPSEISAVCYGRYHKVRGWKAEFAL